MPLDPHIQDALNGTEPLNQLRSHVRDLQVQGWDQEKILQLFEENRQYLRETGREREEDILMEVMDFLVGWCSPHVSLEPKHHAE